MKRIIVMGVFLLCWISVNAQEKIAYSKVIKADSISSEGIFVSIKEWLSMEFKKGNNAIELEDKEAGLIVANTSSGYKKNGLSYVWTEGFINYKINIQIREGRFKVTITNFQLKCKENNYGERIGILTVAEESNYTGLGKKQCNEVWNDMKTKVQGISESWFKSFETIDFSNYKQDTSDDW